jgi:hypothetical protein
MEAVIRQGAMKAARCLQRGPEAARRRGTPTLIVAFTVVLGTQVALAAGATGAQERSGLTDSGAVAERAAAQRVCRDRVSLRHAPGGVRIGYLYRGDRVIVALYARRHRWAYGISVNGYGWLLTNALCRRS